MVGSHKLLTALLGLMLVFQSMAQDTIPKFSIYKLGPDKVLIQWRNPDTSLRQLSIQQSSDSLYRFKTILTMPDPRLPENGTVINRPGAGSAFYRIYLLYPKGKYQFTQSRFPRTAPPPNPAPARTNQNKPNAVYKNDTANNTATAPTNRFDTIKLARPQIDNLPELTPGQKIDLKKVNRKQIEPDRFLPSKHVFAHRDGYAFIDIPKDWDLSQVEIRFFAENGEPLFDLKNPEIRTFRVDKTNFYRAGWQEFEIWLKGKLVEKNKFYLPLEF